MTDSTRPGLTSVDKARLPGGSIIVGDVPIREDDAGAKASA
jgi:hypothetical protein